MKTLETWKVKLLILGFVFMMGAVGGWNLQKKVHRCPICPVVTADTIYVTDTVVYTIKDTVPYYIVKKDTVIVNVEVPADVDTAAIIKDYNATHVYDRQWADTNIVVTLKDYISQNKPIHNVFKYQILRPQRVIYNKVDNSVRYNSYLYVKTSFPVYPLNSNKDVFKHGLNAGLTYAGNKFMIGNSYSFYTRSINVDIGIPIIKFKGR